jgi:hypothetical protein
MHTPTAKPQTSMHSPCLAASSPRLNRRTTVQELVKSGKAAPKRPRSSLVSVVHGASSEESPAGTLFTARQRTGGAAPADQPVSKHPNMHLPASPVDQPAAMDCAVQGSQYLRSTDSLETASTGNSTDNSDEDVIADTDGPVGASEHSSGGAPVVGVAPPPLKPLTGPVVGRRSVSMVDAEYTEPGNTSAESEDVLKAYLDFLVGYALIPLLAIWWSLCRACEWPARACTLRMHPMAQQGNRSLRAPPALNSLLAPSLLVCPFP